MNKVEAPAPRTHPRGVRGGDGVARASDPLRGLLALAAEEAEGEQCAQADEDDLPHEPGQHAEDHGDDDLADEQERRAEGPGVGGGVQPLPVRQAALVLAAAGLRGPDLLVLLLLLVLHHQRQQERAEVDGQDEEEAEGDGRADAHAAAVQAPHDADHQEDERDRVLLDRGDEAGLGVVRPDFVRGRDGGLTGADGELRHVRAGLAEQLHEAIGVHRTNLPVGFCSGGVFLRQI